jgi:hypothetical protein
MNRLEELEELLAESCWIKSTHALVDSPLNINSRY